MKCAKEIVAVNEQVRSDREKVRIANAMATHAEACKNAITYCEAVVGPTFEEQAKSGCTLSMYCRLRTRVDYFGNTHFDVIKTESYEHTVHHRDGTKSKINKYRDAVVFSNIDKTTFVNYLDKHCYSCNISGGYFTIKPKPSCN